MDGNTRTLRVAARNTEPSGGGLGLARILIKAAEEKAAVRAREVETERVETLEQAWVAGFEKGLDELRLAAESLQAAREEAANKLKPELLRLLFSLAEEALGEALKCQPEALMKRIDASLKAFAHSKQTTLLLHPLDIVLLRNLNPSFSESPAVTVVPDENMPRGVARITSENGCWDLNPFEHLRRLERHIRENRLTERTFELAGEG